VAAEILALPLVHTAWLTALGFGLANAGVLRVRMRVEEEGLNRFAGAESTLIAPREQKSK
jgi:methyltransferase